MQGFFARIDMASKSTDVSMHCLFPVIPVWLGLQKGANVRENITSCIVQPAGQALPSVPLASVLPEFWLFAV